MNNLCFLYNSSSVLFYFIFDLKNVGTIFFTEKQKMKQEKFPWMRRGKRFHRWTKSFQIEIQYYDLATRSNWKSTKCFPHHFQFDFIFTSLLRYSEVANFIWQIQMLMDEKIHFFSKIHLSFIFLISSHDWKN